MTERELETLRQARVSGQEKCEVRPRKLPQYMAVLSATLGALSAGMVQGWSSPAGDDGAELEYPFAINPSDFSWVSSTYTLGAAATCIPMGILTDHIGRKRSMLFTAFPFTIGWACVIWANSVGTLIFGRFMLGLGSGAVCVAMPIYIGEIADKETRGRLGSYVELNFAIGILAAYTLGLLHSMFILSLVSAAIPLVFFATFYMMPETPTYSLMSGEVEAAKEALLWLRGPDYDVEPELNEQIDGLAEDKRNKISFFVAIRSRVTIKGLYISFGLMFFQQLSGINAIIFYGSAMFANATGSISDWPIIVVGALQAIAVLLSTMVIDNWGRRLLLFISGAVMCIKSLVLGVYFYLEVNNDITVEKWKWLPLVCICGFVLAIEFGFGPIPWLMMGEIFSPQVRGVAASSACSFNWLMAFAVTKAYGDVKNQIGVHGTFWIFSFICALSVIFVYFSVPETRGKTLEQIRNELAGTKNNDKRKRSITLSRDNSFNTKL